MKNKKNYKRVAIVTGGTRGIGASISLMLAKSGCSILAVYKINEKIANTFNNQLQSISSDSAIFKADVSKKSEAEKVAKFAFKKWGQIDILVNNAGVFDFSFIEDITEEFFDNMFLNNLKSHIFMIQSTVPYIKKQKFGRIINSSSISGNLADVGLSVYAASKSGVDMLTKIAAAEFAPYKITVNAYAPGIIHTDMTDEMIMERGEIQVKQIPLNYFGSGEDIAGLVKFLSSEEASYITGEIIGVNGGMLKVQNPMRAYDYVKKRK